MFSSSSFSPLILLELLVFLLPDVAVTQDCYICQHCLFLFFVDQLNVQWVTYHQFLSLDLEVPQNLSSVVFKHLWRCPPSWPWAFQATLIADVLLHYASHLVVVFHVCCSCLHLTLCYYVLNCLRSIFSQPAPGVLSGVVDPRLYWSCTQSLFLCCQY